MKSSIIIPQNIQVQLFEKKNWDFISSAKKTIHYAAQVTGVSPSAIAGALLEENYSAGDFLSSFLDEMTRMGVYENEKDLEQRKNLIRDALASNPDEMINHNKILSYLNLDENKYKEWKEHKTKPSTLERYYNGYLRDIGPANIQIGTAVRLLQETPEEDLQKLNIQSYRGEDFMKRTLQLIRELLNDTNHISAKIYALYMREAEQYFQGKSPKTEYKHNGAYVGEWDKLPQEFRDALLISYVNLGEAFINKKRLEAKDNAYEPQPAAGTGAGVDHLHVAKRIGMLMNQEGYGERIDYTNLATLAMHNTVEGLAVRRALKHFQYIALPQRNYETEVEELTLYDSKIRRGSITQKWIKDRIAMLASQIPGEQQDKTRYFYDFEYGRNGENIIIDFNIDDTKKEGLLIKRIKAMTLFGKRDKFNHLQGDSNNDNLYGGIKDDTLEGKEGDNYLEGGEGHDTYRISTSDKGIDTIFDSDGKGSLEIDGINLGKQTFSGTARPDAPKAGDAYYSEDKKYGMTYNGVNWEFSVQDAPGHYQALAHLRHWQNGQLGISLKHADDPDADPALVDFDLDHRNNRNYIVYDGTFAPNGIKVHGSNFASSQFTGSGRADVIHTGDGVLHRVVTGNGGDTVKGGAGREYINAGIKNPKAEDDNDTVYAGDNSDIVLGGAGRDEIWAGNEHEDYDTAVIDYKKYEGVTDPESLKIFEREKRGDWVHGQYGNDTIYGSAKEDILIGGEGFDTIRGGAGKDLILGDADYIPFATSPAIMGNITGYHWLADGTPPRSKKEGVMSIPNGNVFSWQWKTEVKEKDSGNESWDFTISPGPSHTALLRNDRFQQLENGNWNDTIYGGEGDDIILGQLGDDTIHGGDGDDVLHGDDFNPLPDNMPGGKDTLYGGAGNDRLFAGGGNATMNGGSGNDIYHSGKGNDTMTDESGDDVYWLSSGLDGVNDQGSGYDTYHIAFDGSMISGFTTISDADGKGSITYRGKALTADKVQVTGENEWRTNDGTAKLTRMGSSLVITNTLEDFKGRIIFNGFFNTGESLGLKLPSLDDDNKPNPDPKTQPDPKPQPEQPQAPTAGKPLAAQSVHEKEKLTYTLAEDTFHTANKDDKLTYSARLADGKPLPQWLNFDAITRTFSGSPGNDDVGVLDIEVSASGKGGSASQRFTLNVINVNDAPQIDATIADYTSESGKPLQYRIPANAFKDIDKDDTLALSAKQENGEPLPSWLTFDEKTGQFSGTPPSAHTANTWRIAVTATDNAGAQVSQTFSLITTAAATNIIRGTGKESIIQGTAGNDTIYAGDNTFTGANYNKIYGNDGDDVIYSGSGRDRLYGGAGNDILYTDGAEYDSLYGGYGDDIYRIGADFREVLIKNFDLDQYDWRPQRHDVIEFAAHKRDDFNIYNYGDNLYLKTRDGKEVSIFDQFSNQGNNWHYINEIHFTDKTLTAEDIKAMRLDGTVGNDTLSAKVDGSWLYGKQGNDNLFSGKGNDYLDGGTGNDTYHFARGFGYDLINNYEAGLRHDAIVFSDMNISDFDIFRERTNLVLRSKDGKDQVVVRNHFNLYKGWQIDSIRFADGRVLDESAINALVSTQHAPQMNYVHPAAQALQMNQAIASLNSKAQPLDALATPDLQPRPLLAAGNP